MELFSLIKNNNFDGLEEYLENTEPDLNETIDNKIPLFYASLLRVDIGILELLVDYGADVNKKDNIGNTPLMSVLSDGYSDSYLYVVRFLLENGADIDIQNNDKITAFDWALGREKNQILNLMLKESESKNIDFYILKNINNPKCTKISSKIENDRLISLKTLDKMLNNSGPNNGAKLEAIFCLIYNIIKNYGYRDEYSLVYRIDNKLKSWFTNRSDLFRDSNSLVQETRFLSDSKLKFVIKSNPPDSIDTNMDLLKEYYVGVNGINKLRYHIPNFMYTFGVFEANVYDDEDPYETKHRLGSYLMLEMIDNNINYGKISFDIWLNIFLQLLLVLEYSQRKIGFCHRDLHTGNVLIVNKPIKYKIILDDKIYEIDSDYYPVIIDYGQSSITLENGKVIGSDFGERSKLRDFLIPAYDMYKFITFSAKFFEYNKDLQNLFKFFRNDPYNLDTDFENNIRRARKKWGANINYSSIAYLTPLMFFDWILKDKKLDSVRIKPRDIYTNISFSNCVQEYNEIFSEDMKSIKYLRDLIKNCIETRPSYIFLRYNLKLLKEYNSKYKNLFLDEIIENYSNYTEENSDMLIKLDKTRLNEYLKLSKNNLLETSKKIIKITLKDMKSDREYYKNLVNTEYEPEYSIFKKYINISEEYYMILNTCLNTVYVDWVDRYTNSEMYRLTNSNLVHAGYRWCKVLNDYHK